MKARVVDPREALAPRSLSERIRRAVEWRVAGVRSRLRDRFPPFLPVVRELHAVTGKGSVTIAADLLITWIRRGWPPPEFTALMLWEVPSERRDDFLTSKDIDPFLLRLLDPNDQVAGRDKTACAEHAREHGIPWVPTLAVVDRREGPPAKDAITVERVDELWPALDRLTASLDVVMKPAHGLQGRGFFAVSRNGGAVDADGVAVARDDLVRRVFEYRRDGTAYGYLVQPLLKAHPAMIELTGVEALSTMRVVTVRHESGNFTLQSFLKIPAPGRLTDNFRRGVSGTVITAMDPSTGRLTDLLGLVRSDHRHVIERTDTHPRTGKRISGRELPEWRECLRVAELAAASRPNSPIYAWDIGLGPNGWVILEANPLWGPVGGQACTGRGLRVTLSRLYPQEWR